MSYTNGVQTLVQSMNGLLTFNDGAGVVIENGVITADSLSLNNISATVTNTSVTLWENFTSGLCTIMDNMVSGVVYIAPRLPVGGFLFLGNDDCLIALGNFRVQAQSIQLGTSLGTIINLFTTFTTGTINFGSSLVTMVLGAFTFLGTSIQAGTSGTFNFFTNVTGSSTVNLFSNMPSGTFNIGKGGNINIGQATTGSLIKIDQNGLDTQVIISPQQGSTGKVTIGSADNQNKIGNLTTVGSTITSSTGTTRMNGIQNLMYNTTATTPAYLEMYSVPSNTGFSNNYLDFHVGGAGSNVDYDVRMNVTAFNTTTAGTGSLRTTCGQQEMLFTGDIPARNLGTSYGLGFGHVAGADDGSYIVGYKPYGAINFGGCGDLNPIASSDTQASMSVAPYYGTKLFNGGLSFDKGTLAIGSGGNRGWVPQCGVYPFQTTAIGAGASVQVTLSYGYTFSANPYVTVGVITNGFGGNTNALVATIYEISTTEVKVNLKNTSGGSTAGSQWGFHYIAWGPY